MSATGEVKAHHARTGQRCMFIGADGRTYWSEVFDWNPKIVRSQEPDVHILRQGGGLRPYIAAKSARRWTWKPYTPIPGEFFFSDEELEFGHRFRGRVFIEPNFKQIGHTNKDWGRERWDALVRLLKREVALAQFCSPKSSPLPGVEQIGTERFRLAAAALATAKAAVLPEGGLHHAAAAVGLPAVVIFGGYISPASTGYPMHCNLFTGGVACGMRINCAHCRQSMARIRPEVVAKELRGILESGRSQLPASFAA